MSRCERGGLIVVACGPAAGSAAEAHAAGLDAAQRGLDLISMRGHGDLLIRRAEDENLAWWASNGNGTRVLRAGLNLASFAPAGVNPIDSIRKDLYSDIRTATFHAKTDRRTLLPLDAVDRRGVLDGLSRLAGLYLQLSTIMLGVRRPSGFVFQAGFDAMVGGVRTEVEVRVTDDPVRQDRSDTVINPSGGRVKTIATRPSPELDQPFLTTFLGETPVEVLEELTHVARIASVHTDRLLTAGDLEGRLTLGGFDVFQAAMGIRGLNMRQPRSFFWA